MDKAKILTQEELDAILNLTKSTHHGNTLLALRNAIKNPLENKKIVNIIEAFIEESKKRLSSFLRKKITVQFISVDSCHLRDLRHEESNFIFSSFLVPPLNQKGLIFFDFLFLHTIINLLYGGSLNPKEPVMSTLGKSGIYIAKNIAEITLDIFQKSLEDIQKTEMTLLKTSQQLNLLISEEREDRYFHFVFQVAFDAVEAKLHLFLPERCLQRLITEEIQTSTDTVSPNQDQGFQDELKHELIDSTVSIRACLPEIRLKVKEVINLKAGDMIPIGDPTEAFILLNQKKLFKVTAGKQNSLRVLKVTDSV